MTSDSTSTSLGTGREYQAAVIGAGPTGLLVAAELALAGVSVVVLERQEAPDPTIKAGSINVATAEILDRRGLRPAARAAHQRFVEELRAFAASTGRALPPVGGGPAAGAASPFPSTGHFAGMFFRPELVDQADPAIGAHPGVAGSVMVRQGEVEALLAAHAAALGVEIVRGVEVTGMEPLLDQQGHDVGVRLATTTRGVITAGWVVGADGGRSMTRRMAGIDFVGTDPEITGYQAIADMDGVPAEVRPGWTHTPTGVYSFGPVPGRILTVQFTGAPDRNLRDRPVSVEELQASIRLVTGQPGIAVRAIRGRATRWTDNARQATSYRAGRVLLAGDAAHVHSPFSGQGLNLGAGDAINLGWKLAATITGRAPEGLLDTYATERHPIGAQVLDWTRAQVALMRGDDKTIQLRRVVQQDLLSSTATTTRMVLTTSGVAQQYDLAGPEGGSSLHPLVGRLVGDAPLSDGSRLADRFHAGRFVLLDRLGGALASAVEAWDDRLTSVVETAATPDCPEAYRTLTGLLVRPDGVIAWATDADEPDEAIGGLTVAMARWATAKARTSERNPVLQ